MNPHSPKLRSGSKRATILPVLVLAFGILSSAYGQEPDSGAVYTAVTIPESKFLFHQIPDWVAPDPVVGDTLSGEPAEYAVARLCRHHGVLFHSNSAVLADLSPLEWPRVLATETPNAGRQRLETRSLLESNGLSFREIIPFDIRPSALADTITAAIGTDHAVLLNSPDAAIIYGYDRREPDHWWLIDRAGSPEIVLESERTPQFTLWSDDPTAGALWLITAGRAVFPPSADTAGWAFLQRVVQSVKGVPESGIEPYPLSLRRFRDLLASRDSLPQLVTPVHTKDPLGILRAKLAREFLIEVLQHTNVRPADTSISEPLRLAEYHVHSSVSTLTEMATVLYGTAQTESVLDSLDVNWNGIRPRFRALELMTELLKSERLASESLESAVTEYEKLKASKPPVKPRRRGRG